MIAILEKVEAAHLVIVILRWYQKKKEGVAMIAIQGRQYQDEKLAIVTAGVILLGARVGTEMLQPKERNDKINKT